jgi:PAS domain S-box-containing protein
MSKQRDNTPAFDEPQMTFSQVEWTITGHLDTTNKAPSMPLSHTPPADGLIVDRSGGILCAGHMGEFFRERLLFPNTGPRIPTVFDVLPDPDEKKQLAARLADTKAKCFVWDFHRKGPKNHYFSITGRLNTFPGMGGTPLWMLIFQDLTALKDLRTHPSGIDSDPWLSGRAGKHELDEATALLIETNVALRKEIRDRQNTLEKLSISEERFRNLTETTSDFIWEIDNAGLYTYASPKSLKLLGLVPEDLIGRPLLLLRKQESSSEFVQATGIDRAVRCGFAKIVYNYTGPDGMEVIIESSGEPIISKRGDCIGFRGIDRDVTERYFYQKQLRQAKDLAESANIAKSEFLANMSHELRTPLHAILSFARYGEKRIDSASRKELHRFFSQIVISGQRLLPLIDSLLDSAKLESGTIVYDFQLHDLLPEIRLTLKELAPLAKKKGLSFKVDPGHMTTTAFFDKAAIAQVLRNIIGNAIKFSNDRTTITVTFTQHSDPAHLRFLETTVSNFGPTIPTNELHAIFDKFMQSSRTKTGAGGSGLGLSICKQIIENHLGEIWASHGESGETRFHFTLPLKKFSRQGVKMVQKTRVTENDEDLAHAAD